LAVSILGLDVKTLTAEVRAAGLGRRDVAQHGAPMQRAA
jgi:hypothetical protein